MEELKMEELGKVSGGRLVLIGGGGGNFGQKIGGNIGIAYTPDRKGWGFSYSHSISHVNGVGTFTRPAHIGISYRW